MPARLFLIDQGLITLGGHHAEYNFSIAQAALRAGLEPVLIVNQRYRPVEDVPFPVLPVFSFAWNNLVRPPSPAAIDPAALTPPYTFQSELAAALHRFNAGPKDHVFIHTVGFLEAEELVHFFITRSAGTLPFFHFLARRDIDEIRWNAPVYEGFKRAVRRCRDLGAHPGGIAFYTDTPELSESYTSETGVEFRTLPIPFRHELIDDAGATSPGDRGPGEPFRFLYLGDARTEKGFHLLPTLARTIYRRSIAGVNDAGPDPKAGRTPIATLTAQANFNSPEGEPRPVVARNQLLAFPPEIVRLHDRALPPERYYRLLAECDAVLIPYDPECYKRRSSGIFAEALAAGKPVVIPEGTSMSAALPPDCGVTYSSESGFVAACFEAMERRKELAAGAAEFRARWRSRHSPELLVRALLETAEKGRAAAEASPPGPLVLLVLDAESIYYHIGAGETNLSQLRFLQASGYRVVVLALIHKHLPTAAADPDPTDWSTRCIQATDHLGVGYTWVSSYTRAADPASVGLSEDLARRSTLGIPASLREFLATHRVDCVYANYAQNLPAVWKLAIPETPVLCEAHDIQAFQYAIARGGPVDPDELKRELAMYERVSATVFVNEVETARVAHDAPGARAFTVRPVSYDPPLTPADLAGPVDLAELISSCGSDLPEVDIEQAWKTRRLEQFNRVVQEKSLDILFVGAHHVPNRLALEWFFNQVFVPFLAPRGLNLFVAGSIASQREFYSHPRLYWTGRVKTLRPLYAAAKTVVLPITDGAGFNMKAMQALGLGKPVVATTIALRGMGPDAADFPTFDQPEPFARRVLELVRSPAAREAASRDSRRITGTLRDLGTHYAQRHASFAAVLGERALPRPIAPPEPAWHGVEWTEAIKWCSEVVRFLMRREPIHPGLMGRFENAIAARAGRELFLRLIDAIFVSRTAPSISSSQQAFRPIQGWGAFPSPASAYASLCARAIDPDAFIPPAAPDAFAGCQTLAEVLSACGSDRADVDLEQAWAKEQLEQVRRIEKAEALHLVAFASGCPQSQRGLAWFVKDVFLPHLAPHAINLTIVGKVEDGLYDHPGVFLAGELKNPRPLVAAAQVLVHPIAAGGEFSPRSVSQVAPTLTCDKPVLGTPGAFWFVPGAAGEMGFDKPTALAKRIRQLLSSREARRLQAHATRRALDAFRELLAPFAKETVPPLMGLPTPASGEPAVCEWSEDDVLIGRLVQKVLLGSPVFETEIKGLRTGLSRDETRRRWTEALRSIFTDRSAPILSTTHVTFTRTPKTDAGDLGSIEGFISHVEPLVEN